PQAVKVSMASIAVNLIMSFMSNSSLNFRFMPNIIGT
ncbi:MAG: hypothetical protein ACI87H_003535, partial [Gammaproteobacteria bacterium]